MSVAHRWDALALRAGAAAHASPIAPPLLARWLLGTSRTELLRHGVALTNAGQLQAADAILDYAMALYPDDVEIAVNHAFVAERRGDLPGFLGRWQRLRAHFPDQPLIHAGTAGTLRKLGRLEEAQDVLAAAQARFPEDEHVGRERAWLAHEAGHPAEALRLWQDYNARFPDHVEGAVGAATAQRTMLCFDAADAILADALQRFPGASVVATNHAVTADARGDREEALRRWEYVRAHFPDDPVGYAGLAAALKMLGRFDAADAVLAPAMGRFPLDANLGINHAWVANARQDWAQARARWQALRRRFPGHETIRIGATETEWHANLAEADARATAPDPAPAKSSAAPDNAHQALFMQFESLGENCELGFVQRHFAAEPLGLLRWAGITPELLLQGLRTGFEGIGSPATTFLAVNPHNREYVIEDRVFGLNMHTFIIATEQNHDQVLQKMCRRLVYLKDRLVSDLRSADKTMVFQTAQTLPQAARAELLAALRHYGDNRLLLVCPGGADHPPGCVVTADGVMTGYLDKPGFNGRRWDISFDVWLRICQAAQALVGERVG